MYMYLYVYVSMYVCVCVFYFIFLFLIIITSVGDVLINVRIYVMFDKNDYLLQRVYGSL
jgi:hypothetical protein